MTGTLVYIPAPLGSACRPARTTAIHPTDAALIAKIRNKDPAALQTLLARHAGWAMRFAERLASGDHQLAEEVVQSAFLKLWDGSAVWEQRAQFKTWFYRVVHNLTVDRLRRNKPALVELDEHIEDNQPSPEQALILTRKTERIQQAIASLPERQRAAIVLSHYEGLSQADAAATLEISEGALESLLSRGRANLRQRLANLIEGEAH